MKLRDVLRQHSYWQLRPLIDVLDPRKGQMSTNDAVDFLATQLLDGDTVRDLWQKMDAVDRTALSYAYHHEGHFNADAFEARYGDLPRVSNPWAWPRTATLFELFMYRGELPEDLMPLLADLVLPPPEPYKLDGVEKAPERVKAGGNVQTLLRADTEVAGTHDLTVYLSLCEQGQISVTQVSKRITSASARTVLGNLLDGDFFMLSENPTVDETVRPFGLDQFTQQAGFVTVQGTRATLTREGRAYLRNGEPELLRAGFERWVFEGEFDELNRIAALYGAGSQNTILSQPSMRRDRLIEALSWCPIGVWIDVEDFYTALRIWEFNFPIETTYETNLGIGSQNSYWASDNDYWRVVHCLYINALIWEYCGTIGAVDLLYLPPIDASLVLDGRYRSRTRPYFSLYDGLYCFRINPLGAFLFGQADSYESVRAEEAPLFEIDSEHRLTLLSPETLTPNARSRLELVATPIDDETYRLDRQQILSRLEEGLDWKFLTDFLHDRHRGPLPASITEWLEQVHTNSRAFERAGDALYVKAASADLVDVVVNDVTLGKFCTPVGANTIVLPASRERTFRRRLKELGYLLS